MKKTYIIILILLSFAVFVTGCYSENVMKSSNAQNNVSTLPTIAESPMKANYQFKDDEFYLAHYIYGIDLCLPEFAFTDATKINPEDLYLFFCWVVDAEKLYNYKEWFNENEKTYHVPASVIEPTLKKYLNIQSIDVSSIKGYDKDKNEIINPIFAGWGGGRWAKLDKKEYLGNNIIRLTATFYDDTFTKKQRTNIYVIQIDPKNDRNYKYFSIVHNP